jgi:ribonuclease BN (tRNA processing enzyme)
VIVTVLGSGCAVPTHRRACAGYLVEWSGGALLLDASAGTYMRALKAGLDPLRLRAVLFSHEHMDHTADLPALLHAHRKQKLEPPTVVREYPFETHGLCAVAFPADHTPEAVCLRLEAGGKVLAYSGDTADCEGLRGACRGADLALLECTSMEPCAGHMTPTACAAVVAAARPKRVLLTHLGPDVETDLPLAEDGMVVAV